MKEWGKEVPDDRIKKSFVIKQFKGNNFNNQVQIIQNKNKDQKLCRPLVKGEKSFLKEGCNRNKRESFYMVIVKLTG